MLVIRKSDGRVFGSGPVCSVSQAGIVTPTNVIPFVALASAGVTPVANDFEVVETSDAPVGHFDPGFSHEWDGSAVQSVPGYTPPAPPEPEESQP